MNIKKNLKKKLLILAAASMLLIPSFIGAFSSFNGAYAITVEEQNKALIGKKAKVVLHKISNNTSGSYQNTGDVMSEFQNDKPIEGVNFKVIDVTSEYQDKLKAVAGGNVSAATDAQRKKAYEDIVAEYKMKQWSDLQSSVTPIKTGTTNASGEIEFADLDQVTDAGQNKVYVFVEDVATSNPKVDGQSVQIKKSVNTVLALPIIEGLKGDEQQYGVVSSDKAKAIIHIYPKNETNIDEFRKRIIPEKGENATSIDDGKPGNGPNVPPYTPTTVDSTDTTYYRSVGEKVKYEVTFKLPDLANSSGKKVTDIILTDLPDLGLSFFSIDKITIALSDTTSGNLTNSLKNDLEANSENFSISTGTANALSGQINYQKYTYQDASESTVNSAGTAKMKEANKMVIKFSSLQSLPPETLTALSGKKITLEFTLIVNGDAPIATNLNNWIGNEVKYDDGTTDKDGTSSEFVIIYKKGFEKINGENGSVIKGSEDERAGFVLRQKNTGYYYAGLNKKGEVMWVGLDSEPQASEFETTAGVKGEIKPDKYGNAVTNDNGSKEAKIQVFWTNYSETGESGDTITGKFDLPGLRAGEYTIVEVHAPKGFYIDENSNTKDGLDWELNSSSKHIALSGTLDKIKNYPRGFLPSTGGIGIVIFIVIGVTAMGIGAYALVRNRKSTGNIG
ncbi:MAG: LPXTG cell wall anchor domain-containing protein [Lactobacillales bacterium]|jgi:LPXTG-motif cell wall-anchored protein|nr:LPXTG cell wall anchor domain-containing protein [Lactobacillales bacterium]